MKPYSQDLRLRVLAAVDRGVPREEAAKTFSVSVPTIKRWLKRRRETGDVEPTPIPGRPPLKGAALQEWLPSQLQENDDLTLRRAPRGLRRADGCDGLDVHAGASHHPSARGLAAQKKSKVAQESATRRRGACGGGWLPISTLVGWCLWTRAGLTPR